MGKMARAWENRTGRNHSLSQIVDLLVMKAMAWLAAKKEGKPRANRIPLILGDSGIGKSTVLRTILPNRLKATLGMPWIAKLWHVGTQGFEDVTGMPIIDEIDAGDHIQKVAKFAKSEFVPGAIWDTKNHTLGVIDELASAPTLIQNQLREIIDGSLNGEPVDPNCFYVGTSNPPDPRFTTVNAVDAAVEKRLKVYVAIPTNEELLQVWNEIMPDFIYKFLVINTSFIDALAPREWHGVAQDVQDILDGTRGPGNPTGDIELAIGEASDELYDKPAVESALRKFIKFGDDPYYYPILGRDLIQATTEKREEHLKLVGRWFKDDQRAMVGAVNSDLIRALNALTEENVPDDASRNVFEFLKMLSDNDCIDMVKTSMETLFNGPLVEPVSDLMRESTSTLKKLADAVSKFHQMRGKMNAAASF